MVAIVVHRDQTVRQGRGQARVIQHPRPRRRAVGPDDPSGSVEDDHSSGACVARDEEVPSAERLGIRGFYDAGDLMRPDHAALRRDLVHPVTDQLRDQKIPVRQRGVTVRVPNGVRQARDARARSPDLA